MRSAPPVASTIEFDTFSVAVGLAVIAGGLALLAPYLDSLTAALAALAGAGCAAGRTLDRGNWTESVLSVRGAGLLCATVGTGAFFLLPGPWAAARGLALALSLVPLWLGERRRAPGRTARPRGQR